MSRLVYLCCPIVLQAHFCFYRIKLLFQDFNIVGNILLKYSKEFLKRFIEMKIGQKPWNLSNSVYNGNLFLADDNTEIPVRGLWSSTMAPMAGRNAVR